MADDYKFPIQTPQGPAIMSIPAEDMKQCPCGSDLFKQLHRVTWVRPTDQIGAEPVRFVVNVFLCAKCDREIGPDDKSVRAAKA